MRIAAVLVAGATFGLAGAGAHLAATPSADGWKAVPLAAHGPISSVLGRNDPSYRLNGMRAINRKLHIRFAPNGVTVAHGADNLRLSLRGVGYGAAALQPIGPATPRAQANRVDYLRPGLTEWYANGPLGLEQGFTLAHAPLAGSGELTVALDLDGTLARSARMDGTRVRFGPLAYGGLVVSDATGRTLPARLDLRPGRLLIRVDDRAARYPVIVDPTIDEVGKLTASDGVPGDSLGVSVAVSGDTIVVGAPGVRLHDHFGQGAVYVFLKPASGWANATQAAKLTASDGSTGSAFGLSVGVSGNTIAVGAPGANPNFRGAVYVFVKPGGGWVNATQTAKLTASDGVPGDGLGVAVAIDGDTIAAGAPTCGCAEGAVYVFVKPGGGWVNATQTAKLTASEGAIGDALGSSVSISGGTVVGGAPEATSGDGAVYIFVKPGGGWVTATQTAKLLASGGADDGLGNGVAIDGDTVAAGAPFATVGANSEQGLAYVFVKPGGGWVNGTQTATLTASDGAGFDNLGWSVAISGDSVAAGSPGGPGTNGAVYVFEKPGGGWTDASETLKFIASDGAAGDQLGFGVAISGEIPVGGAPGCGCTEGAAYVFSTDTTPPAQPTGFSTSPGTPSFSTTPKIRGTAEAGSKVKVYTNNTCTGPVAGTDTAANFGSTGVAVTVGVSTTTRFWATATDQAGNTSGCGGSVTYRQMPLPTNSTAPSITNGSNVEAGKLLTADQGTWTGNPGTFRNQWVRCDPDGVSNCAAVTPYKEGRVTYLATSADVGHTLRVRFIATNAAGDSAPATSERSGVVIVTPPVNTTVPSIVGGSSPQAGSNLGSNPGKWAHYPTSFKSQFLRCRATGTNCVAITPYGVGGPASYTVRRVDRGYRLRVRYIASNAAGDSNAATSAATPIVS